MITGYLIFLKSEFKYKLIMFKKLWKQKRYLSAFTYDMDRFNPYNIITITKYESLLRTCATGTAIKTYSFRVSEIRKKHKLNNKHHWEYWWTTRVKEHIPTKYLKEMICEWDTKGELESGMGAKVYYLKNIRNIKMTATSRIRLCKLLKITAVDVKQALK